MAAASGTTVAPSTKAKFLRVITEFLRTGAEVTLGLMLFHGKWLAMNLSIFSFGAPRAALQLQLERGTPAVGNYGLANYTALGDVLSVFALPKWLRS